MANKGNTRHIKRLASSKYVNVSRKTSKYLAKLNPGRHSANDSIAITTVIREKIGAASNAAEARLILRNGLVQVNGKQVKEEKYPVGFNDVIVLKPDNATYRITVGRMGTFTIEKIKKAAPRELKVTGKYVNKGNKIMLRLHDGTIIPGNAEIKVNDTVIVKEGKLDGHIRLEKGAQCLVVKGTHAPEKGTIEAVKEGTALRSPTVEIKGSSGAFETLLENIMATKE